jgi:Uma2 family endonuclease
MERATMSTTTRLMTADELLRLPRDGMRHELVRGELRTMPLNSGGHGIMVIRVSIPVSSNVEKRELGLSFGAGTGFHIAQNPDTVLAPDFAFVHRDRIPLTGIPKGFWPGPPDLAVEVVSPTDTLFDVEEKVDEWLAAGVAMVWVVNPKRKTVTVYRSPTSSTILTVNDELDGQDVVPGFRCRVSDLFV